MPGASHRTDRHRHRRCFHRDRRHLDPFPRLRRQAAHPCPGSPGHGRGGCKRMCCSSARAMIRGEALKCAPGMGLGTRRLESCDHTGRQRYASSPSISMCRFSRCWNASARSVVPSTAGTARCRGAARTAAPVGAPVPPVRGRSDAESRQHGRAESSPRDHVLPAPPQGRAPARLSASCCHGRPHRTDRECEATPCGLRRDTPSGDGTSDVGLLDAEQPAKFGDPHGLESLQRTAPQSAG